MKGSAVGYVWDYVAWNAMILRLPQPSPFESDTSMPIGIRPINDFAYKKIFGSPENTLILISLLNAILNLSKQIIDVTIVNPYNLQDFKDDKLSILDIKAVDQDGAIYDIEMQLSIFTGLIKRIVFYGCEVFAGQLKAGDDYSKLKPVYSICLLEKTLWDDSPKVHHAFRFTDALSGRTLINTLEIHTLELGWYNLKEGDLPTANALVCWIYWLLHAHEYDRATLLRLLPDRAFQLATQTLNSISEISEDKQMYDAREKAIRDQKWALNASRIEGKIEGEIKLIRALEEILQQPAFSEEELAVKSLDELQTIAAKMQAMARGRIS